MKIFAEQLLTSAGWRENQVVEVENGVIRSVEAGNSADFMCRRLTPGLFDIHQHGGAMYSANCADLDGLRDYLVSQAECGVTDVLMAVSSHISGDDYSTLMDFLSERHGASGAGRTAGRAHPGRSSGGPVSQSGEKRRHAQGGHADAFTGDI